jgi:hypothetical protein
VEKKKKKSDEDDNGAGVPTKTSHVDEARVLPHPDVRQEYVGNFGSPASVTSAMAIASAVSSTNGHPGALASLVPVTVARNNNLSRQSLQLLKLNLKLIIMSKRAQSPSAQSVVVPILTTSVYFKVIVLIARNLGTKKNFVDANRSQSLRELARSPEEIYLSQLKNRLVLLLSMMGTPLNRGSWRLRRSTKVLGSSQSFSLFWCMF